MSNIVVSGYYGSKNAGDEAMLAAMIEVLSELDPQTNITVISANPPDTKRRHGVEAVSWLSFSAIWKALRASDLLVSGGGSLLQNVTSRRSLYYYMAIIVLAFLARRPVMLYAQGIGPIEGFWARTMMRLIGNRVRLITVRDHGSLAELSALGISRPKIVATADPVLAINPVPKEAGRQILQWNGVTEDKPLVGISVREWKGWQRYKETFAETADRIATELGANIVFLPMQYPEDVKTAEMVAALMKEEAVVLDGEFSTAELLSLVGNMDLLLAIRLHALIFAGVMGVPLVGVSYDPKIDRFLDSIGEAPAAKLETVTADELMAQVRRKWQAREVFREKNAALLNDLRHLAFQNAELAVKILREK
ncbi:polysaccharide pyruvyl transferase CsaB [Selenomonas sp.]|uniref:polysaccharide pyruvyl transferase CsaB n=1 Tax=Selenomonas sp. TaxID=2053611 RepID=UPI003FA28D44